MRSLTEWKKKIRLIMRKQIKKKKTLCNHKRMTKQLSAANTSDYCFSTDNSSPAPFLLLSRLR